MSDSLGGRRSGLAVLAALGAPEKATGVWLVFWGAIFIPLATAGIAWATRLVNRGLRDLGLTADFRCKDALIGATAAGKKAERAVL